MGGKNKKQRSEQQPTSQEKAASASTATRSIAVPGSIIAACATPEAAAAVASQIARNAAVFGVRREKQLLILLACYQPVAQHTAPTHNAQVSEVVVVDEAGSSSHSVSVGTATLARLLQYMETPPHLRGTTH
jgi:predicted SPOUT superfamily RNA methylase MTH1